MRATIPVTLLIAIVAVATAQATEPERSAAPTSQTVLKSGKERLSDKATDEQRGDDCKVAPDRRTRARPTACP